MHSVLFYETGCDIEGFDDTDETDLDLKDEPVPVSIEVLVLSCI